MKLLFSFVLIFTLCQSSFGQIINPKDAAIIRQTKYIEIYEVDRHSNECSDAKNVMLVDMNGKRSSCFKLKKKLKSSSIASIKQILLNKSSFQKTDDNCFTTDFGMLFFDDHNKVIGNITTSLLCNNIVWNDKLPLTLTKKATQQLNTTINN